MDLASWVFRVLAVLLVLLPPSAPAVAEPVLRVCTTGDYAPLTLRDPATGQYSGVDVEMARDLAEFLGRTPVFVAATWPTLTVDLQRCDIAMGGISITEARRQLGDFTIPYLATGKVALAQSNSVDRLQSIEQINQPGVRVIVNPGGTNEQFARRNFPNADVTVWPDNTTIFDRLAAGYADVMVTDGIEARYQSRLHPGLMAVNPDRPFTDDQKAYLLPSGSVLTGEVDSWLRGVLADGRFDRLLREWIG